jgi:hypothetical protein
MAPDSHDNDWRPCRRGELQRLQQELPGMRRGAKIAAIVGSLFLVALVTAAWLGGRWAFTPDAPPIESTIPVSISCPEVLSLLAKYRNGDVSPALSRRIEGHLKRCSYCRDIYQKSCPDGGDGRPAAPHLNQKTQN